MYDLWPTAKYFQKKLNTLVYFKNEHMSLLRLINSTSDRSIGSQLWGMGVVQIFRLGKSIPRMIDPTTETLDSDLKEDTIPARMIGKCNFKRLLLKKGRVQ